MKRKLSMVIGGVLLLFVSFMGYHIFKTIKKKKEIGQQANTLPAFRFYKQDKTEFNLDSLHNYSDRLIIEYFSPDCEHCQYTAQKYVAEKEKLQNCKILMVTFSDSLSVAHFYQDYKLNTMPNIIVLSDPGIKFPGYFGAGVIPSFYVYKNNRLVNKFLGETRINNLLSDTLIKL
ncbi:peroxiredoxin family protein [Chitinophaga sp. 22321]|uniref:Redoxin domain-containing protein n=1 Tax=Chitinophaga hostae TaxID=2831022 RepID=A0ABS5J815_9BACT|nr:thioredoxin domain-containing protein [Chitinophaga hostae]MBS0031354.1 redoxin domain-containing protein [Chitinophaga hostae]